MLQRETEVFVYRCFGEKSDRMDVLQYANFTRV